MQLSLRDDLPFVEVELTYQSRKLSIEDVLVDTGSATTILAADIVAEIQIAPMPDDDLHIIRGVGGREAVFTRVIDNLRVGERSLTEFEIEVGGMDYGFEINGILGMDFLTQAGAIIDLGTLRIEFAR
ncbi:MAG: retropepsin-like aspartic protease [Chloroflexota bacterium]|nr:retropepsin-like aspartic protease [Chloroflexota bacterium]